MTFFDISMKMLRVNFRRYQLYFGCNVFSVMLFYCFAAIFSNRSFMDTKVVDSLISSNIIAPSVFVAIFMVLFIPYTYRSFMKNRKHEYGILMTLGMSATEVLTNVLLENCVIALGSLIVGLTLGTILSLLFFFFIHHVIGIAGLQWYFNVKSYLWTAVLYAATLMVTLAVNILELAKIQLTDLIKEKFRAEKEAKSLPGLFTAGVILVVVSVPVMLLCQHSGFRWLGLPLMFVGVYLMMTHGRGMEDRVEQMIPGYRQRHLLGISFIRQHDRSRQGICFIAAWMIAFSVFFGGIAIVLFPVEIHNASRYSPYDLVYSQFLGQNQVKDSEIVRLLGNNGVSVEAVKQVNYLRNGAFNLFSVSEVNQNLGCHYQVAEGRFLMVFQYDLHDGYERDLSSPKIISFNCGKAELKLRSAGSDVRILVNDNPTFADHTLVLNDADYTRIASQSQDYWQGTAKLYTFADWKKSQQGIDAVQNYLLKANHLTQADQMRYYRASSRIQAYSTGKQSAEFFLFLMVFIAALFCLAANLMTHFKVMAEADEEERMLSGLNRIGVSEDEMLDMVQHKNVAYYLPQVVIGVSIGVVFNYSLSAFYGYEWRTALSSLIIGIPLTAFQMAFVQRYSQRELTSFGTRVNVWS